MVNDGKHAFEPGPRQWDQPADWLQDVGAGTALPEGGPRYSRVISKCSCDRRLRLPLHRTWTLDEIAASGLGKMDDQCNVQDQRTRLPVESASFLVSRPRANVTGVRDAAGAEEASPRNCVGARSIPTAVSKLERR